MADFESKNLAVILSAEENFSSFLTCENLHFVINNEAKISAEQSLSYIKSGQKEIRNYVDNVIKPSLTEYEQTVEEQMQSCVTNVQNFAEEITEKGYATTSDLTTALSTKQDTLISGTNLKTVNNESLLGSGNIPAGVSYTAGTGIDITNDVISVTSAISSGASAGSTALQPADVVEYTANEVQTLWESL